MLLTEIDPKGHTETYRVEIPLNSRDGRWLGTGSGNLFIREVTVFDKRAYPLKGKYHYILTQSMTENNVTEISDIGLQVEPVL